jgi:hypothetical protein
MSRSMVKLIHADGFFPNNDVHNLRALAESLEFVRKPYGQEVPNFNLIFPDSEIVFNKVLGERVIVDPVRSGVIRRPHNNAIHYEHFETPDEWCFVVALEPTTINFWYHIDPTSSMGELGAADSRHALEGAEHNYNNLFEWRIHSNILMEPNQCLFFRPWVFHSLQDGLVQYYRLLADTKRRILVMGMPGSKKSSIAEKLQHFFDSATVIKSMDQRVKHKDLDFTEDGQLRHCYRMLKLARESTSSVTILDMACPLPKMREILNPDIVVWVSDKSDSQYEELNQMYVPPVMFDVECTDDDDHNMMQVIKRIVTKRI